MVGKKVFKDWASSLSSENDFIIFYQFNLFSRHYLVRKKRLYCFTKNSVTADLFCVKISIVFFLIMRQSEKKFHCNKYIFLFSPVLSFENSLRSLVLFIISFERVLFINGICPAYTEFLTTYCVWYPHAVPFLRNKILYSLLKTPKAYVV